MELPEKIIGATKMAHSALVTSTVLLSTYFLSRMELYGAVSPGAEIIATLVQAEKQQTEFEGAFGAIVEEYAESSEDDFPEQLREYNMTVHDFACVVEKDGSGSGYEIWSAKQRTVRQIFAANPRLFIADFVALSDIIAEVQHEVAPHAASYDILLECANSTPHMYLLVEIEDGPALPRRIDLRELHVNGTPLPEPPYTLGTSRNEYYDQNQDLPVHDALVVIREQMKDSMTKLSEPGKIQEIPIGSVLVAAIVHWSLMALFLLHSRRLNLALVQARRAGTELSYGTERYPWFALYPEFAARIAAYTLCPAFFIPIPLGVVAEMRTSTIVAKYLGRASIEASLDVERFYTVIILSTFLLAALCLIAQIRLHRILHRPGVAKQKARMPELEALADAIGIGATRESTVAQSPPTAQPEPNGNPPTSGANGGE
jgi:hypothetical protein